MGVFNDSKKRPAVKAGYGTRKKAKNTIHRLLSMNAGLNVFIDYIQKC